MLLIFRSDVIGHAIRLEHVFLAKQYVCFLMCSVCSQHISGDGTAALLFRTTFNGVHLHERSRLVRLGFFGIQHSRGKQ